MTMAKTNRTKVRGYVKRANSFWQEITRKVYEGSSCLYQKHRLDCLIALDENESE